MSQTRELAALVEVAIRKLEGFERAETVLDRHCGVLREIHAEVRHLKDENESLRALLQRVLTAAETQLARDPRASSPQRVRLQQIIRACREVENQRSCA